MGQALLMWHNCKLPSSQIWSISLWPATSFHPILWLFAGTITICTVLLLITLTLAAFYLKFHIRTVTASVTFQDLLCLLSRHQRQVIRFLCALCFAGQKCTSELYIKISTVFCMHDIWFKYNTSREWLVYSIERKQIMFLKVLFSWPIKSLSYSNTASIFL